MGQAQNCMHSARLRLCAVIGKWVWALLRERDAEHVSDACARLTCAHVPAGTAACWCCRLRRGPP
jgi:hypothetical protein